MDLSSPISPSAIGRFLHGAQLPGRALSLLFSHRALWPLALAPILLTGVGLVVALSSFFPFAGKILGALWTEPSGGALAVLWSMAQSGIFIVMTAIFVLAVPLIVASPFNDALSAKTEQLALGQTAPSGGVRRFAREIWVGLWHSVARIAVLVSGHALLLPLMLIPGLNLAYPFLGFLFSATWLAFEYLDVPMARNLHGFQEVRAALREVRPLSLGFGSVLTALFLIPLAGLLIVPVGVVAGTLLYADLKCARPPSN